MLFLSFHRPKPRSKSQQHPVSVVISARDEAFNLNRNLPKVLNQDYSTSHEVIVVNHNSQDDTRFILEEFKKNHKELQSVNLEQEAKGIYGKKYPLSIGIKEAKYEILLLTDADCQPGSPHWMKRMQDGYLEETDIVLGFGSCYKRPGLLNALIRFETFQTGLQYLSYALAGLPYMGVGRNLSYKKKLFIDQIGRAHV